jgi:hypothetical protein
MTPLPPPPPAPGTPWESPGPVFTRIIDTVREVLFRPTLFFQGMPRTGGLGAPLVFYLLTASTGLIVSLLYQLAFPSLGDAREALLAPFVIVATAVVAPVLLLIGLFIGAGIYHLMLMLLGAARYPFETTFRVVAYSGGATAVIGILPLCGGLVAAVWQVVASIIGLAQAQQTSTGKAAAAVLVPFVACCAAVATIAISAGILAAILGVAASRSGY